MLDDEEGEVEYAERENLLIFLIYTIIYDDDDDVLIREYVKCIENKSTREIGSRKWKLLWKTIVAYL